jgi:hypothetical protein
MLTVQKEGIAMCCQSKLANSTRAGCDVSTFFHSTLIFHCPCRAKYNILHRWKGAVVQKIKRLEDAIAKIATKVDIPELGTKTQNEDHLDSMSPPAVDMTNADIASPTPESPVQDEQPSNNTWGVVMDPRSGPGSIPASCLSDNIRPAMRSGLSTTRRPDLISTGLITMRQGLALFDTYHLRLDHFLYRILGDHISLDSVRSASPLLTAAVCTVGALHSPSQGQLFETCYSEFKGLVSSQIFSQHANEDDIRGLCIGAFWLHELSWALIGNGKFTSSIPFIARRF